MTMTTISLLLTAAFSAQAPGEAGGKMKEEGAKGSGAKTIYEFTVKDIDGKEVRLERYRGDVMMIVNTASRCGYTDKTYSGLESLYEKYRDKGLKILAFPANNFGGQEPLDNAGIKEFCAGKHVTFDVFAKVSVAGDDQVPLYRFLTEHPDEKIAGKVEWNFQKYIVGRDGTILAKFNARTLPEDPKVIDVLEKALAAKKP